MKKFVPSFKMLPAFLCLLLTLFVSNSSFATVADTASITTDKQDYEPESLVTITGSGFTPGETVTLQVAHTYNTEPDDSWYNRNHGSWTVKADAYGNVSSTWWCDWDELGKHLTLTAIGGSSGLKATHYFTDGAATTYEPGSTPMPSLLPGGSYSFTQYVTSSEDGNVVTLKVQGTGGNAVPAAWVTSNPESLTFTGNNPVTKARVITIKVPLDGAPGNYTGRIDGSVTSGGNATGTTFTLGVLAPATNLSVAAASGTYGATTNLSATLTQASGGGAVSGKTVTFSLNGTSVGTASTNASGVATLSGASLSGINAGSYASGVTAAFAGDASYSASNGSAALTVAKATATLTLSNLTPTYNATAQSATVTTNPADITGVSVTYAGSATAPTNAGTYAVVASLTNPNYTATNATGNLVIAKANATVTVNGYTGIYDNTAHGATGTATGVGGVDLSASLSLGSSFTNVPGGTANWSFNGGTNYNNASGTAAIVINKATATLTLSGLTGTYDGNTHVVTASVSPTGLGTIAVTYDGLTTAPTNAGSYAIVATLTNANYQGSATGTLVVDKANATISVSGFNGPYDGSAHGATGSAKGITNNVNLSSLLHFGNSYTNVPGGVAHWTFDGNTNYAAASGDVDITINKATATLTLSGLAATYTGTAKSATVTTSPASLGTLTVTYDGSATAPTNAGTYAVVASLDNPNYTAANATGNLVIGKATATVSVNGYTGTYDAAAHGATGTATGVGGVNLNSSLSLGSSYTNYPGGTANWTFDAGSNYNTASGTVNIVINKATASISLSGLSATYNGEAQSVTTGTNPSGLTGLSVTYDGSATAPTNAGNYAVVVSLTNNNYTATNATGTFAIAKAPVVISLSGLSATYDGNAHAATAGTTPSVSGLTVKYDNSLTAPTNAGSYAVVASLSNANYTAENATGTLVIGKATAIVNVTGFSGTYDAASHGASGTATGIGGAELSGLNLGASFTNAPGGTADWTFSGGTNYNDQSGSVAIVINKATASVNVTGYTGTYDGSAHSATGTATGVGGVNLNSSLSLGSSFTNAPGGSATWSFNGGTNYNNDGGSVAIVINKASATIDASGLTGNTYTGAAQTVSASTLPAGLSGLTVTYNNGSTAPVNAGTYAVTITLNNTNYTAEDYTGTMVIAKADPTVSVNGYTGAYDGASHGATGSATGIGGVALPGLDLGASFTNAPGGTANWSIAESDNYNAASGSVAVTIGKANATVIVNGSTSVYDGATHGATGTATGVNGEVLSGLDLGDSFINAPGGTANWSFAGNGNYNASSGTAAVVINKATANISVSGLSGNTFNGSAHSVTASTDPEGLSGLTVTYNGGNTAPTNAGTYTVKVTLTNGNYEAETFEQTMVIAKADPTVSVNGYTGAYDGASHGATGSATGVGGVALPGLDLGASFSNAPGGTANWSIAESDNYNAASGSVAITIGKANAIINTGGYSNAYDGSAHGATGTATGVNGENLSSLLNLGSTYTNVPGGTASWTFAGNVNYNSANGSEEISISKAAASVSLTANGGVYTGIPYTATATSVPNGNIIITYNGSVTAPKNAGTYNVTAVLDDPNFEAASDAKTMIIEKAPVTINVTPASLNQTYTGSVLTASVSVTPNVSGLSVNYTGAHTNAGSYPFTASLTNDNYKADDVTNTLVIGKATATITIAEASLNQTYSGSVKNVTASVSPNVSGLSVSYEGTHTNAGSYGVTASLTNDNYAAADVNKTLVIAKANAVVNVTPFDGVFDGLAHGATAATATGVNSDDLTSLLSVTGSHTNCPGGQINWSFAGNNNYNSNSGSALVKIAKQPVGVTVTVTPSTQQYSDVVTLTAKVPGGKAMGLTSPNLNFNVSAGAATQNMGSVALTESGDDLVATWTGQLSETVSGVMAPGAKTVTATLGSAFSNYSNSGLAQALTVTKEHARVAYTGWDYISLPTATTTSMTISLASTVTDSADGSRGNVKNAKMSYSLGSPTAAALGGGLLNVTPTQDSTVGSTGTSFTTALNSSQVANGGETFTIYQNLGGYYQGASNDPVTLTVGLPGANFVTGGGYLLNNATAGKYAGTKGMKTNLGFTMQYNKSGTNLKGQCNIIVRSGGRIYQIKSNAINSLNVGTADKLTGAIPAMFNTKANFTDITDPLLPVSLGGNMDLTVNMLDVSTGGQGDQVSIHLQASTGELFFSSNWSTTTGKTALQVLGGGNVSVKTNGVAAGARTTDGTATTTTVSTTTSSQLVIDNKLAVEGLQVQVGPNPTINQFTVTVSSNESAAITMRVSDASGRMVDLKPGITPNSTVTIGANYKSGMYYLEVIQGNTRKMVKLMKIN